MKLVIIEIDLMLGSVDLTLEDGRECRVPLSKEAMNNLVAACAPVLRDGLGDVGEAAFNTITKGVR